MTFTERTEHPALAYAAGGLEVLPLHWITERGCSCGRLLCPSPGKHPLLLHGKDEASASLDKVSEWLGQWPTANWAVRPPDGIVVIDMDPRNGGDASLTRLVSEFGELPLTLTTRTGSGGTHQWFGYRGPNPPARLAPGIDVKARSGYVLVPPSMHANGMAYSWLHSAATVPAPPWLRRLLARPAPARRTSRSMPRRSSGGLENAVRAAPEGNRNSMLFWAACRAIESGDDDVLDRLAEVALERGLQATEIVATIVSAQRTAESVR